MISKNIYKVAIYMRLSRDDGDDRESESIENQRDIIENFISEHEEFEKFDEYADDGYTGTNFNRPDFKRMINDIEEGKIDCIITKDLSRFGRDHIDTGYYLERYLPLKNIRYIAIGDNVDTLNPEGFQFLTFKLSFNDYYAQDISNKIKSVKRRKIEKGEFQGNIAPYGYKKDTLEKNHLVIDEEAAKVIYDIFDMYVNKDMSSNQIAKYLNEEKILSPAMYLKIPTCMKYKSKNPAGYVWTKMQVCKFLKNEIYIGSVVGGKSKRISHKLDKVVTIRKSDYVIVENRHEPIIDKDTWQKAQEKLSKHKFIKKSNNTHPLKKYVYCAECGGKATLRVKRDIRKDGTERITKSFVCSTKNSTRKCKCKSIRIELLEEKVYQKIIEEMKKIVYSKNEIVDIYEKAENITNSKINELNEKILNLKTTLSNKEKIIDEMYNDKLSGIITQNEFERFHKKIDTERKELLALVKKYEFEKNELETGNVKIDYNMFFKMASEFLQMKNITSDFYEKLIEKIEFDSEKNIKITFTFNQIEQAKDKVMEVS